LRFHLYTERLPEERVWQEAIHLSNLDPQRHVAVVATIREAGDEEHAVGVARFARAAPEDREAEAAIVVRDDFQRKGLGRVLLTYLAAQARELGITHFAGWVLAENIHLMKLIKKLEVKAETEIRHGERKVRVAIF
jgi:GNAT superfamily N-acetyltransferase